MIVKYFVPEDGDELSHPNVFELPATGTPTLAQFKKAFPYPGQFHFRFLTDLGLQTLVWLDVIDDDASLPLSNKELVVKASRLANSLDYPSQADSLTAAPVAQKTLAEDDLLGLSSDFYNVK